MRVLVIARASVLRIVRDRTALFFLLVLPILVIIIVGATARGFATFQIGVDDAGSGSAGQQIAWAIGHTNGLAVTRFTSVKSLTTAVALGDMNAGVVIPAGVAAAERTGANAVISIYAEQVNTTQQAAATAVTAVILRQGGLVQAATFAAAHSSSAYPASLRRATALQAKIPHVAVTSVQANSSASVLPQGYSYSAPTELVLFVFLMALSAGAQIIETRRLGMYERMLAAPVRPATIIAGESLTYVAIALAQSILIVAVGAVAFGVSWGNPLGAAALVLTWSVVGAGAGMLSGTLFKTPEQASAIGPTLGIALAMLGGCMWPLAIVGSTMRLVGHFTPQAWAVDAWTSLLSRHGTIVSIAPDLGVLAGFALVLFAVSTTRLRRQLA